MIQAIAMPNDGAALIIIAMVTPNFFLIGRSALIMAQDAGWGVQPTDEKRRALAWPQGAAAVEPNPMVGCVLVRDSRSSPRDHRRFGGLHRVGAAGEGGARRATAYAGALLPPGKTGPH
jgi:hypothetical protein